MSHVPTALHDTCRQTLARTHMHLLADRRRRPTPTLCSGRGGCWPSARCGEGSGGVLAPGVQCCKMGRGAACKVTGAYDRTCTERGTAPPLFRTGTSQSPWTSECSSLIQLVSSPRACCLAFVRGRLGCIAASARDGARGPHACNAPRSPQGGALPYELHKLSLETVGPYDVAGAFSDMGQLVGGYKIVPAPPLPHAHQQQGQEQGQQGPGARKQRLVVMGAAQSGPDVLLRWAELDEAGALAAPPTTHRLPGAAVQSVHDFWVTDGQYVVVQAPLDFNPEQFVTRAAVGAASFAECLDWDAGRPAVVHLVPRPQPQPPKPPAPPKQHVPGGSKGVHVGRPGTAGLGGSQSGTTPPPPPPQGRVARRCRAAARDVTWQDGRT